MRDCMSYTMQCFQYHHSIDQTFYFGTAGEGTILKLWQKGKKIFFSSKINIPRPKNVTFFYKTTF